MLDTDPEALYTRLTSRSRPLANPRPRRSLLSWPTWPCMGLWRAPWS